MKTLSEFQVSKVTILSQKSCVTNNVNVEKISKGCMDSIPSPSPAVKIQIMGKKVCFRPKGKTLLGIANKLLNTKVC